ncbi:MAG: DUF839 domain-containing protein [Gammaproteobacteria bacterium]|jgi:secreted PhoX family phosphatase|nr:DUF839 domain-containing protein [Gammaproteobacteria bacterium]
MTIFKRKPLALLIGATTMVAGLSPALAAYEAQVQDAYIAYYGRPADPEGLKYWANILTGLNGNLDAMIEFFGNSPEFQDRYGMLDPSTLINGLYQQAFGRDADSVGLTFYLDLLNGTNNSGFNNSLRQTSLAAIALDILNGATGNDANVISNRAAVAEYFTDKADKLCAGYPLDSAVDLMSSVTSAPNTVVTARATVDSELAATAEPLCFAEVPVPETDEQKRAILASDEVRIGANTYAIGYDTLARSGDQIGTGTFGQVFGMNGMPVLSEDGSEHISIDNDFSSFIPHGEKLFAVSGFEYEPGAVYVTELLQDPVTGDLDALSTKPIDATSVGLFWQHCAGSVTPWNTHLGSEEYEPNARYWDPATGELDSSDWNRFVRGFTSPTDPTPYNVGFVTEIAITGEELGSGTFAQNVEIAKHYAMGRSAVELGYVMPDRRTVYISDDGTNVGLWRFVADTAGDLSSGTLYAAKWNQTSTENGGSANLDWISLGAATSDQVKQLIDSRITFDQIFSAVDPTEEGQCPGGYSSVNTTWGHECLQLKEGMEVAASRLETRRYAAMLGATVEFRKMEGITHNPDTNTLYIAMSEVARGMEDFMRSGEPRDSYDIGGPNHIRLPYNLCGTVYALDLTDDYVATNMYGLVSGRMTQEDDPNSLIPPYAEDGPFANNSCDLNGIANPDNVTFIPGYSTLVIGEDTGSGHQNDVIWSYNLNTERLTRIQTTPYGSETTSPYFYPNINGFAYLSSVVQHPYGESDQDKLMEEDEGNAYNGYIGPMPALQP